MTTPDSPTPDLSDWATDMATAGLEPGSDAITVDGDGDAMIRILFAFNPTVSQRAREGFILTLGRIMAEEF